MLYWYRDPLTKRYRQRQTSASTTPFALAQRHLPRELLQELRMPAPPPTKAPRKKAAASKPRAPRKKKEPEQEDASFQAIIDSVPTVRPPTPPPKDPELGSLLVTLQLPLFFSVFYC